MSTTMKREEREKLRRLAKKGLRPPVGYVRCDPETVTRLLDRYEEALGLIADGLAHLRGCRTCDPSWKAPNTDCLGCRARRFLEEE